MAAALSPDGRTLVIDLQGTLWTLPAAGGAATRIGDEYLDARQPAWAPDGKRIAFQGYADGTWHVYVINADGSGVRALTSGPFDDREPSWSRDGNQTIERNRPWNSIFLRRTGQAWRPMWPAMSGSDRTWQRRRRFS